MENLTKGEKLMLDNIKFWTNEKKGHQHGHTICVDGRSLKTLKSLESKGIIEIIYITKGNRYSAKLKQSL